jgi:hypothetical protein
MSGKLDSLFQLAPSLHKELRFQFGSWQFNAGQKLQEGIVIGALKLAMARKWAEIGRLCRQTVDMISGTKQDGCLYL